MPWVLLMETVAWKLFLWHDTVAFAFEDHMSLDWIYIMVIIQFSPAPGLHVLQEQIVELNGMWVHLYLYVHDLRCTWKIPSAND